MDDILRILDKEQGVVDINKISRMLGLSEEEVSAKIESLEADHIITGYKTIVNWDKTDREVVRALIDLRVTPQRG